VLPLNKHCIVKKIIKLHLNNPFHCNHDALYGTWVSEDELDFGSSKQNVKSSLNRLQCQEQLADITIRRCVNIHVSGFKILLHGTDYNTKEHYR
jgi:hypothetical protein